MVRALDDIEDIYKNTELKHICISQCQLGYDNIEILAQQLQYNRSVTNISIKFTDIHFRGTSELRKCIQNNRTLIEVYLEFNNIDLGSIELSTAIGVN